MRPNSLIIIIFLISKLPNVVSAAAQQQRRSIQQCPRGPRAHNLGRQMGQRRGMAAWDDTWRIEMTPGFPCPGQLHVAVLVVSPRHVI